jgi:hypothetical protein
MILGFGVIAFIRPLAKFFKAPLLKGGWGDQSFFLQEVYYLDRRFSKRGYMTLGFGVIAFIIWTGASRSAAT